MMMSSQELEEQIEKLVRDHLAAYQKAVTAAVERAFTSATSERRPQRRRTKAVPRARETRRSSEELATLAEQLYAAVCATPGETMMVLAAKLGTSPRSLQIPSKRLRRAGRVRSAGRRQHTRYFPMSGDETKTRLVAVGSVS